MISSTTENTVPTSFMSTVTQRTNPEVRLVRLKSWKNIPDRSDPVISNATSRKEVTASIKSSSSCGCPADSSGKNDRIGRLAIANEYYETALHEDALDLLDNVLVSFPVYDLSQMNDSRFRLAALALDDVEITSEKILVTLSLQRFIITLAGILGTFLLFIVIFLGPQNTIRLSIFLARLARGKSDDTER